MPVKKRWLRTLVPVVQFCVLQRDERMISRVTEALSKVKGSMGATSAMHCLVLSVMIFCDLGTATLPVHLHYFDGGDRGNHGHHTRLLTAQREQLVLERDALTLNGAT